MTALGCGILAKANIREPQQTASRPEVFRQVNLRAASNGEPRRSRALR